MAKRKASQTLLPIKDSDEEGLLSRTNAPVMKQSKSRPNLKDLTKDESAEKIASAATLNALPDNATTVKSIKPPFIEPQTASNLPEDILLVIFAFVQPRILVHKVSLVCQKWKSISRSPTLWHKLDDFLFPASYFDSMGITECRLKELLGRHQFSELKTVCFWDTIPNSISVLAEKCPTIEEIRADYFASLEASKLLRLPTLFPNLEKVRLLAHFYPIRQDWVRICKEIGTRLVDLYIRDDSFTSFNRESLNAIGQCCTNLKTFHYSCWFEERSNNHRQAFTKRNVMTLVANNPHLEKISLINTKWLGSVFYKNIIGNAANLNKLAVLGYDEMERKYMLARLRSRSEALEIKHVSKEEYKELVSKYSRFGHF